MNGSLVPANTKRATLIFGMLRLVPDLPIIAGGTILTIALLLSFGNNAPTWLMLVCLIPMLFAALLVMPIPNYHNTLCAIQSILRFYNGRRKYIWRGWCIRNEFQENK